MLSRVFLGSFRVSGFLPQSKDVQVRFTGYSKLPVGLKGCLILCVIPATVVMGSRSVTLNWKSGKLMAQSPGTASPSVTASQQG